MRQTVTRIAFTCAVIAGLSEAARASFIQNSFGLDNPTQTITFEEHVFPSGTPLTDQYIAEGVTFSGMTYNPEDLTGFGYAHIVGHAAGNFSPVSNPFSIYFTTPQSAAAFALISNPGELTTFAAYLGGVFQEGSGPIATSSYDLNNFFGFTGFAFDEIRISSNAAVNGALTIDLLQFGSTTAVPEPSSLMLACLALIGAGAARRRCGGLRHSPDIC